MVNLYELLGIKHTATEQEIKQAIAKHYTESTLQEGVLTKAKEWLLNPQIKAKYDAQLLATYPELKLPPTEKPKSVTTFANLYDFLGVPTDATEAEILSAISSLELQHADARQINLCKNYLLNKDRRNKYDVQHGIVVNKPVKRIVAKKQTNQPQSQQVVVKKTGCLGVAGGILLAIAIIVIAPILLLGLCTAGTVATLADKADERKEKKMDVAPKPIPQSNQAEDICLKNGGFDKCYALSFQCKDGVQLRPEKWECAIDRAQPKVGPAKAANNIDKLQPCLKLRTASKSIAKAHQDNIPKYSILQLESVKSNPDAVKLVDYAYDQPKFGSEKMKAKAIEEFAENVYNKCMEK